MSAANKKRVRSTPTSMIGSRLIVVGRRAINWAIQQRIGGEIVEDLLEDYLRQRTHRRAASTIRGLNAAARDVLLLVGKVPIGEVNEDHCRTLLDKVARGEGNGAGGQMAANNALALLDSLLQRSIDSKLRLGPNPAQSVRRFDRNTRHRVLSAHERAALWSTWIEMESRRFSVSSLNVLRTLMLTGCRSAEIQRLAWTEVDEEHQVLRLETSKTGPRIVPVGRAAMQLICDQPRKTKWVFPSQTDLERPVPKVLTVFRRSCQIAGIDGAVVHTLRHSWATTAADLGVPIHQIQAVLGHSSIWMTDRYVHAAVRAALPAADRVAAEVLRHARGDDDDDERKDAT